ncbi:MAG: hypothetical protein KGI27_14855, partial [Thaumarchaeota archaeon]|nr:hypothetical protein [Nitrososphaerota archaeon]
MKTPTLPRQGTRCTGGSKKRKERQILHQNRDRSRVMPEQPTTSGQPRQSSMPHQYVTGVVSAFNIRTKIVNHFCKILEMMHTAP